LYFILIGLFLNFPLFLLVKLLQYYPNLMLFFQLMKLMAVRRVQIMQNGKSDVPLPPAPPPHPGYAPNAALHAIKRHAQEFISPKENEVRTLLHFPNK
jgi:hypothetical protein